MKAWTDEECDAERRKGWLMLLPGLKEMDKEVWPSFLAKNAEYERFIIRAAVDEARREHGELLGRLLRLSQPPGDWACRECHPNSDMLHNGFRCAYHETVAILARDKEPRDAER